MRTIKFRGKEKKGNWVYGYLSYAENEERYYIGVQEIMTPVIPETVGQFTGLLDKNGNEVWEGDRFGYGDEDPSKFTVIYSEKNGMFGIHYDGWDDDTCSRLESHTFEMTQRIGNIHDHELEN